MAQIHASVFLESFQLVVFGRLIAFRHQRRDLRALDNISGQRHPRALACHWISASETDAINKRSDIA
jgi:hypothetical protein